MIRRTRNFICIWILFAGLANYLAYGIMYAWLQGDAKNGYVEVQPSDPDAAAEARKVSYFVGGHFIRHGASGKFSQVTRNQWIYSYIHSTSMWATHAALLLAMLTMARPHIIATMRASPVRGPTFITVAYTLIVVIFGAATAWFALEFFSELHKV